MDVSESTRIAARLSLHEFLLEQIIANVMLQELDPLRSWNTISADLVSKMRFGAWSDADAQDLVAVQAEAVALAERFSSKVRERIEKL